MFKEKTMKYFVVLILIILLSISVIFTQTNKSSIDKRTELITHSQKDNIYTGIHQNKLNNSDYFLPHPQNYGDKVFFPNYSDHMENLIKQRYLDYPMYSVENDGNFNGIVQEAWISRYGSGLVPASDLATDIVTDSSGNVYVTGYSTNTPYGMDYYTAKYNTSGVMEWSVRYDRGLDDLATEIEIDNQRNLYVTGYSWDSETDYDYATVKYNSSGIEQWVARYNGSGNGYDRPYSLAVDEDCNVYVTGYSADVEDSGDYATVKYNKNGEEQWVSVYDGPNNGSDGANDLAIDIKGNVYVTGSIYGNELGNNYGTIKYNSNGEELWSVFYNGSANLNDYATSIAIDLEGNVYITGISYNSFINCDYTTLKYNTDGEEQWIMSYNGPGNLKDYANDLTIDNKNNVYITGSSFGSDTDYDCATLKYNSDGEMQWVSRYNGPGNDFDYAYSLIVDIEDNVYIAGCTSYSPGENADYVLVKYNAVGMEQWSALYNGSGNSTDCINAFALDGQGNVIVTGKSCGLETKNDYATLKYNEMGVEQWSLRYNGPGNSYDLAYDMDIDTGGNVYVTGFSAGSGAFGDYATIKYNAMGEEQWKIRYNGPGNHSDNATALVVDNEANVYVTGTTIDSLTAHNYGTIKYTSEGEELWAAIYNGPGNGSDDAKALAVDPLGNVYVTGRSLGSGTDYDYATVKYNSVGVLQWVARYNGPDNGSDEVRSLAFDTEGNVFVTGRSYDLSTGSDIATIKYNSAGVQQWVVRYNGSGNGIDNGEALAVDLLGNVYVTGNSQDPETSFDFATIKYNAAGVQQWVAKYNGTGNSSDGARALSVDEQGNLYVAGTCRNFGTGSDYTTIKYDSAGVEQWVSHYNGLGNFSELVSAMEVDQRGNVYVTGQSFGSWNIGRDYATVKYNSNGEEQWVMRYNGSGNTTDIATAMAIDGSDNVYITGHASTVEGRIYTTIKYTQTTTGINQEILNAPNTYVLNQNYPNPFNPITNIQFSIPKPGYVTLKIYNMLGEEVITLVSEKLSAGQHNYEWNASEFASGIYLYKLETSGFIESKKLILLK